MSATKGLFSLLQQFLLSLVGKACCCLINKVAKASGRSHSSCCSMNKNNPMHALDVATFSNTTSATTYQTNC